MSRFSVSTMRSSMIGRSPEMPCAHSPGCAPAPRRMVSEDGRKIGVGIDQVSRETLEETGFARIDAEVMELHLRLGPGERGRAIEGAVS